MNRHSSKQILRRRIALCSEYASLFNEMCESVGIKSTTISGYVHEFDFFPGDTLFRAEHAWSTVYVNDRWELMDLTWGAGHLEPKRQLFKNLMWVLFEKPYEVEWHYVHAYNPDWFYVDPSQMVASHFPVLDFFQLINNPISMEEFNKGFRYNYAKSSVKKAAPYNTPEIKAYLGMGESKRLDLECSQTKRINPVNNRLIGFNNYLFFKELYSQYYNPETKEIEATIMEVERMKSIKEIAVENLKKSIANNTIEYDHYHRRSEAWEDTLVNCNNRYYDEHKQREKLNKIQIKSIKKIDKKTATYTKSTRRSANKFKRTNVAIVKRPKIDKENPTIAEAYIALKDSLMCDLFNYSYLIDSLFNRYNKSDQNLMASTERAVTSKHFINTKLMFKHNLEKMMDYAFIYFDESLLDKPWLAQNFENANQQNLENLDSLLKDLTLFLPQLKENIRLDQNQTKAAIKALKSARKNSYRNLNEKQIADSIITAYKDRMKSYSLAYRDYFHIKGKVEWYLKFTQKNLKRTQKALKKDVKLEKQRHKNYMAYRESIRKSENHNMKILIKQLQKMDQDFIKEETPVVVRNTPVSINGKRYSTHGKPSGNEDVPSSDKIAEMKFVEILNKERKKRGLSVLKVDYNLCRAARYHSYDMGVQSYFEHATYDRNLVNGNLEPVCKTFDRIRVFGACSGENIAAGNSSPENTYTQWYNSPGHYRNMFDPKWNRIGIGYIKIEGSPYTHYWTTDFGY